jgi:hypothetical protein
MTVIAGNPTVQDTGHIFPTGFRDNIGYISAGRAYIRSEPWRRSPEHMYELAKRR